MRKNDEIVKLLLVIVFFCCVKGTRISRNELPRIRVITDEINLEGVLIQEASVMEGNITGLN